MVFNAKNWISSSGKSDNSSIVVSCGGVSQTLALTDSPQDYTVVLRNCEDNQIKLAMTVGGKRFYIYRVDVYNGDLTARLNGPHRVIVEEGDSTWRMVSGIIDTCYTVKALAGGDYEYLVKAIYTDGTQSVWSNVQYVTLTGESATTLNGDVNGDGEVNIVDVTALIDYLLGQPGSNFNYDIADVNHDGEINIVDVTAIIDILLSSAT